MFELVENKNERVLKPSKYHESPPPVLEQELSPKHNHQQEQILMHNKKPVRSILKKSGPNALGHGQPPFAIPPVDVHLTTSIRDAEINAGLNLHSLTPRSHESSLLNVTLFGLNMKFKSLQSVSLKNFEFYNFLRVMFLLLYSPLCALIEFFFYPTKVSWLSTGVLYVEESIFETT